MNAQELIDTLTKLAKEHNVPLDELDVFYRENYDSDHQSINWVFEDAYDSETNSVLQSVVLIDDGNESSCEDDED